MRDRGAAGFVYRCELAGRVGWAVGQKAHSVWRTERKQALTAVSSSRWAGAITRAVADQYQLGVRGLAAHVADLRAAGAALEQRCALRPGELAPVEDGDRRAGVGRGVGAGASQRRGTIRQDAAPRGARTRVASAQEALVAGPPSITVGGKRLWRNRNHLEAADMTEQQALPLGCGAKFLTADGESGKPGGNETSASTGRASWPSNPRPPW